MCVLSSVVGDSTCTREKLNNFTTGVSLELTDAEINGQAFTFFLAGFETTASLLRYVSHTLALHPDIDKRLYEEIVEHIGEVRTQSGRVLRYCL